MPEHCPRGAPGTSGKYRPCVRSFVIVSTCQLLHDATIRTRHAARWSRQRVRAESHAMTTNSGGHDRVREALVDEHHAAWLIDRRCEACARLCRSGSASKYAGWIDVVARSRRDPGTTRSRRAGSHENSRRARRPSRHVRPDALQLAWSASMEPDRVRARPLSLGQRFRRLAIDVDFHRGTPPMEIRSRTSPIRSDSARTTIAPGESHVQRDLSGDDRCPDPRRSSPPRGPPRAASPEATRHLSRHHTRHIAQSAEHERVDEAWATV